MKIPVESLQHIAIDGVMLEGLVAVPTGARGLVLFAHGSGSSRHSPRNNHVAQVLQEHGMATLLMDLLTTEEDLSPSARFDIALLTDRLVAATRWMRRQALTQKLPLAYFGASTGAAAALCAASRLGSQVQAVVSRGGRPDLAGAQALASLDCPTLLLVGGLDDEVLQLNRLALKQMRGDVQLTIVPGATHLFEEPGTLDAVARHASRWFERHLRPLH